MVFTNFLKRRGAGRPRRNSSGRADDPSSRRFQNQVHAISTSDSDAHEQGLSSWRCRGSSHMVASHPPPAPVNASIPSFEAIPTYVQNLADSRHSGEERASRALRKLFAISQVAANPEYRHELAPRQLVDGDLIPTLFEFLGRCEKASSEQYTALLILNNLSIPEENKGVLAIGYGGAKILSRLLVEDPSCHLAAIILVNLTFADPELRSALVSHESDIQPVESLSFALRVASMTREEYEHRHSLVECDPESPKTAIAILATVLADDMRRRSILGDDSEAMSSLGVPPPSLQLFPETARWCLTALKNLSRPSNDSTAACSLIKVGIVPHILRFLKIDPQSDAGVADSKSFTQPLPLARFGQSRGRSSRNSLRDKSSFSSSLSHQSSGARESSSCDSDSSGTPVPVDPEAAQSEHDLQRSPEAWDDKSSQDAALFIVLNLSAIPLAREYIREIGAVHHLLAIVASDSKSRLGRRGSTGDELLEFQRLKSRLALSFLLGSDSHDLRPKHRGIGKKVIYANLDDVALMVSDTEVTRMVELLANTIHRRSKAGAGGYSAATFCVKCVLMALRRLMASYENQVRVANAHGARMNALLLKAVALHSLDSKSHVDAEAAECACFSLYLLSSHGFQDEPFLPSHFGSVDGTDSLTAKVLKAYADKECTLSAGKHAASQLQLRLKYLVFDGDLADLVASAAFAAYATDYSFGPSLRAECDRVVVTHSTAGAIPDENIFDRPILRRRMSRHFNHSKRIINWNDNEAVDFFSSALQAVCDFSFNSNEVRHLDAIDDILIANNIAHSANGEKTESYNYMWSWQDTAGEIQRHLEEQQSSDPFLTFGSQNSGGRMGSMNVIDTFCGS